MQLRILAVGRARPGPEAELTADYLRRIGPVGRGIALGPAELVEIDPRKAAGETLLERAGPDARLVVLDERGNSLGSGDFSARLTDWRDDGTRAVAFLIGGADGHPPEIRARADLLLAFGAATWPHMLVRAMLAEQIYRAVTIAANHPYHREG